MRPTFLVPLSVVAALACGGGSSGGGSGGGGGGGGTGARLDATGAVPVQATQFTSVVQSTSCAIGPASIGVAFAAVGASDQAGMCGYLQQGQEKQNAKTITLVAVRLNPLGAAALVPDTYPVVTQVSTEQKYAFVVVSQSDAVCATTDVVGASGNVVITSVAGGRVKGTANVTLEGGGTVTGTFDAPSCAVDLLSQGDVCTGQIGPASPACVP
jgi:hypothetical protein